MTYRRTRYRRTRPGKDSGMPDIFYQQMYAEVTTDAVEEDLAQLAVQLPQPPTQFIGRGVSMIYELLKFELQVSEPLPEDNHWLKWTGGVRFTQSNEVTDAGLDLNDYNVICAYSGGWNASFTTSGRSMAMNYPWEGTHVVDLQDAKGNGKLCARQTLYFCGAHVFHSGATYAGVGFKFRMWYRFRKVSLTEYIGMLSEQTMTT